jgi:hypothetical protein
MAPLSTLDISIGLAAIAVATIAIYLFIRAGGGTSKSEPDGPAATAEEEKPAVLPSRPVSAAIGDDSKAQELQRHLEPSDLEGARSSIRTLTLKRELLTMVLKRLFEAEDDGEITREERVRLSKGYESELKQISEDLRQSELVVTLHELESIRDDIVKKFEETLNSTQAKIDSVLKELKLEKKEQEKAPPRRRRRPRREEEPTEEEEEAEEEEEEVTPARPKSDVEARLEQLRMEVLKELEELEKLELEA